MAPITSWVCPQYIYDKAAAIVGIKRIPNLRRLKMKAIMNSEIRIEPPTVADHPILLWSISRARRAVEQFGQTEDRG